MPKAPLPRGEASKRLRGCSRQKNSEELLCEVCGKMPNIRAPSNHTPESGLPARLLLRAVLSQLHNSPLAQTPGEVWTPYFPAFFLRFAQYAFILAD